MKLEKYLETTNVKPDATAAQIEELCGDAVKYGFPAIDIRPQWLSLALERLRGTGIEIAVSTSDTTKAMTPHELGEMASKLIREGADRIAVRINRKALAEGDLELVKRELEAVVTCGGKGSKNVSVEAVFECSQMSHDQKLMACQISTEIGATYVASGIRETTVEDVRLLRSVLPERVKVKASGGVRTGLQAWQLIGAGAERVGTSTAVHVLQTQSREDAS